MHEALSLSSSPASRCAGWRTTSTQRRTILDVAEELEGGTKPEGGLNASAWPDDSQGSIYRALNIWALYIRRLYRGPIYRGHINRAPI